MRNNSSSIPSSLPPPTNPQNPAQFVCVAPSAHTHYITMSHVPPQDPSAPPLPPISAITHRLVLVLSCPLKQLINRLFHFIARLSIDLLPSYPAIQSAADLGLNQRPPGISHQPPQMTVSVLNPHFPHSAMQQYPPHIITEPLRPPSHYAGGQIYNPHATSATSSQGPTILFTNNNGHIHAHPHPGVQIPIMIPNVCPFSSRDPG